MSVENLQKALKQARSDKQLNEFFRTLKSEERILAGTWMARHEAAVLRAYRFIEQENLKWEQ